METISSLPVVFLPGGIMPTAVQYEPLLSILDGKIQPLLKDLEVYTGEVPSPGYDLDQEVEGLKQAAQDFGFQNFHLVGYSGGGAIALAFTATYPEMVRSLALSEPAEIPSQEWYQQEADHKRSLERVMSLPPDEQMPEFVRLHLRPGVQPPPPLQGVPPPWMVKRPAGLKAMSRAFFNSKITLSQMKQFQKPVYLAIGSLSNPYEERKAKTMAQLFPDFRVEIYEGRHHFDPPQRAEPERFARALNQLWVRAEKDRRES
jgi:pimeloyl-ACP methyl ester carboxylesterase